MTAKQGEYATSLLVRVVSAQALVAAVRTGLLGALLERPRDVTALADALDLAPFAVQRLVDVLAADDLLIQRKGSWHPSEVLRHFNEEMPQNLEGVVGAMSRLPQFLRTGRPVPGDPGRSDYTQSVAGLGRMFAAAAEELAESLEHEIDSVLDLGTGSGVFGIAVARRHDAQKLVGFDHPDVVTVFQEHAAEAGLTEVATAFGGDFLKAPLPGDFDCTLICNVLRILPPQDARRLIGRAMTTLAGGGRLVIVDVMGEDPPERASARAVYRLDLALRNDSGGPHDDSAIRRWIEEAGGAVEKRTRLQRAPLGEEALFVMTK